MFTDEQWQKIESPVKNFHDMFSKIFETANKDGSLLFEEQIKGNAL